MELDLVAVDVFDFDGRFRRYQVGIGPRHGSHVRPGLDGGDLYLEPSVEFVLLRPDAGHLRAGVTGDHGLV